MKEGGNGEILGREGESQQGAAKPTQFMHSCSIMNSPVFFVRSKL